MGGDVNDALMPSIRVFCIDTSKYIESLSRPNNPPFFGLISVDPKPKGLVPPLHPPQICPVCRAYNMELTNKQSP